jgi:hypothetical protein
LSLEVSRVEELTFAGATDVGSCNSVFKIKRFGLEIRVEK